MKQNLIILGFIASFVFLVYLLLSMCVDKKHKYAIGYEHGKYSYSDYTDTFEVNNGVIKYTDENGNEVTRYGTFSIKNNADYKK